MIGASGAISAVLGAYLVLFPGARILSLVFLGFFYQLIEVPAVLVLGFWFVLQLIDGHRVARRGRRRGRRRVLRPHRRVRRRRRRSACSSGGSVAGRGRPARAADESGVG